jgi:hypothetical protein
MDLIAKRSKIACDRKRCGSGADKGDLFAVRFERPLWHQALNVAFIIGGDTLEAADRDGLLFDAAAAAGRLARAVAGSAKDAGKHVGIPVDHVRLGVAAFGDEANVLGNRRVRRACVLAVDYLVEIFRISDVGGFHLVRPLYYFVLFVKVLKAKAIGRLVRKYLSIKIYNYGNNINALSGNITAVLL